MIGKQQATYVLSVQDDKEPVFLAEFPSLPIPFDDRIETAHAVDVWAVLGLLVRQFDNFRQSFPIGLAIRFQSDILAGRLFCRCDVGFEIGKPGNSLKTGRLEGVDVDIHRERHLEIGCASARKFRLHFGPQAGKSIVPDITLHSRRPHQRLIAGSELGGASGDKSILLFGGKDENFAPRRLTHRFGNQFRSLRHGNLVE